MKNKLLFAFAMVLCLGLTFAAYALRSNNSVSAAGQTSAAVKNNKDSCGMADCCKDGHCAMNGSCCKSGDNCPLKDKAKTENTAAEVDYSKITYSSADGKDCCASGASCCQGGACCKGKRG